jgi:hypothetical protein
LRKHWGFTAWSQFNAALWQEVKTEAQTRARNGPARDRRRSVLLRSAMCPIRTSDRSAAWLAASLNDRASIALDLSGSALHQRGYRQQTGQAPLKENLANPDIRLFTIHIRALQILAGKAVDNGVFNFQSAELAWLNDDRASIALDLSGSALHQRGYRQQTGQAPLKENRLFTIHIRALQILAGKAVDNGVFNFQSAELAVADRRESLASTAIWIFIWVCKVLTGQRCSAATKPLWCILHTQIKIQIAVDAKLSQRQQDAGG